MTEPHVLAVARPEDEGKVMTLECKRCGAALRIFLPVELLVSAGAVEDFTARHKDCDGRPGAKNDVLPGWVFVHEGLWPEGFDEALAKAVECERDFDHGAAFPLWLRDPAAALLAVELIRGASEEYDCASWGPGVEVVVEAAKRSLEGPVAPIDGWGCVTSVEHIRAIGLLCQHVGGWPGELHWLGTTTYFPFTPIDPPMVWEAETARREAVVRRQIAMNNQVSFRFDDVRRRVALDKVQEPWLRLLLRTHGEDRVIARQIDRGEP